MVGTGAFAEPALTTLYHSRHQVLTLVTNPDRPAGKERDMVRPIKKLAQSLGIPVFQPASINAPEAIARLRQLDADLLVVAAYGQILSAEALQTTRRGGINIHASLLPKYRGAAPVAWAIYHGETRTGVTIIQMNPKMDAGDILAQAAVDILPEETAGELEARLAQLGARLALETIDALERGTVVARPQESAQATRAPRLKKEHGLIDWSRPAAQIVNHIRAMQPWPTAYTFWHHGSRPAVRIILYRACAEPGPYPPSEPGTVVAVNADSLVIAAGEGYIVPVTLQVAGGRCMSAPEFLRGHRVQIGDRFGPEHL
ncbi:MAG: methionyl-tRNA formyltransferase [Gemmataceae bacterium]